jgi:pimeloyl-ACP methyl ester carboxylesterase
MKTNKQPYLISSGQETFVLVHGAWHGGWCWQRVEGILQSLGHSTVAPDLPGHGRDRSDIAEQTLDLYVDRIVQTIDQEPGRVILVGHSLGGPIITKASMKRAEKIKKLIYLSAFMLLPGQSCNGTEGGGLKPMDLRAKSTDGKTVMWGRQQVLERFAQNCSANDREYIMSNLCVEAIAPLVTRIDYDLDKWNKQRRFYITGQDDKAVTADLVGIMLQNLPCDGVYSLRADHSSFCSAPQELSYVLHNIALTV